MLNYRRFTIPACALFAISVLGANLFISAHPAGADTPFQANAPQPAEPEKNENAITSDPCDQASGTRADGPSESLPPAAIVPRGIALNPTTAPDAKNVSDFEARPLLPAEKHKQPLQPKSPKRTAALGSASSLYRALISLIVVLTLIMTGAYLFRRFNLAGSRGGPAGGIEILARNGIGPKQSLCVVKFGQRLLLVGLGPNYMTTLDAVDEPTEMAHIMGLLEKQKPSSISNNFRRLFRHEAEQYDFDENANQQAQYEYAPEPGGQWHQAKGELASLLGKVKGLTRIRPDRENRIP